MSNSKDKYKDLIGTKDQGKKVPYSGKTWSSESVQKLSAILETLLYVEMRKGWNDYS